VPCGQKYTKQEYITREGPDQAILSAQALVHVECFLKTMKLSDPNASDEELLECIKESCDQKLRQCHSRRTRGTTNEPMDEVEADPTVSDPPTGPMAAATPISPPQKKRRLEPNASLPNSGSQSGVNNVPDYTPYSERTTSNRSASSRPDDGPRRSATPEGDRISLHIETDFDSNSATLETKIHQRIDIDEVSMFGDWFQEVFSWGDTHEYT